jgi:hypothetical protein
MGNSPEGQQSHPEYQCVYGGRPRKRDGIRQERRYPGNTDESWQRGLDYLLQHYLFNVP